MISPRTGTVLVVLALVAANSTSVTGPISQRHFGSPERRAETARRAVGGLPLVFEPNAGQWDSSVRYTARAGGHDVLLTTTGAVLRGRTSSYALTLRGANGLAELEPQNLQPGVANYFTGADPSRWRVGVPTYGRVRMPSVYPGVDLVWRGTRAAIEYDFVVAPGADPSQIALMAEGAGDTRVTDGGDLLVTVGTDHIRQRRPVLYQDIGGARRNVDGGFSVRADGSFGFRVGPYDASKPLVIDPLIYATYLGGTDNDDIQGVAFDADGNVYVAGNTGSTDFPIVGGLGLSQRAIPDVFVSKLNSTATTLLFSTYLGGSAGDGVDGFCRDASGNFYVGGHTRSTNFPTTSGALQTTKAAGDDGFISKLNSAGSSLLYSSYLGGAGTDTIADIGCDASSNFYVGGYTDSTDFPTTAGAFRTTKSVGNDGYVTKVNTGTGLVYSTYLGGNDADQVRGMAVDTGGNAYVVGITMSSDFPTTSGSYKPTKPAPTGVPSAFLVKLNATGTGLSYGTFLGGAGQVSANSVAVDPAGAAYVAGATALANFPTTPGAFQTTKPNSANVSDGFVTKFNPTGTSLVYATWLNGTDGADSPSVIGVDGAGRAWVGGNANSTNFPTMNPVQANKVGGFYDAYLAILNPAGSALVFSTYLGGCCSDTLLAMAIDGSGNAYVGGATGSTDFPATPGVYQPNKMEPFDRLDSWVAKIATGVSPAPNTLVQGFTWYSDGQSSKSGPAGTVITAFATSAANASFKLVTGRDGGTGEPCRFDIEPVNPAVRFANSRGFIPNTSGPVNRPPGEWQVCFRQEGGGATLRVTLPLTFTVTP